jgi:hypothetical protein
MLDPVMEDGDLEPVRRGGRQNVVLLAGATLNDDEEAEESMPTPAQRIGDVQHERISPATPSSDDNTRNGGASGGLLCFRWQPATPLA